MSVKDIKTITYRKSDSYGKNISCVIVEGKFLEELGFKLGHRVKMDYQKDKITMSVIKEKIPKPELLLKKDKLNASLIIEDITKLLRLSGLSYQVTEFRQKAFSAKTNKEFIKICNKYVIIYKIA